MSVKRASPVAAKRRKVCRMGRKGDSFWYNGGGFRVSSWGVLPFDCLRKRGSRFYRFNRFNGGGAAHKIIKRREVLKYTLSTKDEKTVNLRNLFNL